MLLHPHSQQPSPQGQRNPPWRWSLERRARSPGKKAQIPPRGDLLDLLAYLLLSACPRAGLFPFIESEFFGWLALWSRRRVGSSVLRLYGAVFLATQRLHHTPLRRAAHHSNAVFITTFYGRTTENA